MTYGHGYYSPPLGEEKPELGSENPKWSERIETPWRNEKPILKRNRRIQSKYNHLDSGGKMSSHNGEMSSHNGKMSSHKL